MGMLQKSKGERRGERKGERKEKREEGDREDIAYQADQGHLYTKLG